MPSAATFACAKRLTIDEAAGISARVKVSRGPSAFAAKPGKQHEMAFPSYP